MSVLGCQLRALHLLRVEVRHLGRLIVGVHLQQQFFDLVQRARVSMLVVVSRLDSAHVNELIDERSLLGLRETEQSLALRLVHRVILRNRGTLNLMLTVGVQPLQVLQLTTRFARSLVLKI
jgi:hypothetical protein